MRIFWFSNTVIHQFYDTLKKYVLISIFSNLTNLMLVSTRRLLRTNGVQTTPHFNWGENHFACVLMMY